MKRPHELRRELSEVRAEMTKIDQGANGGALEGETEKRWTELSARADQLTGAIDRATKLADMQRHEPTNDNREEQRAVSDFNIARGLAGRIARMNGDTVTVDDGLEREVSQELQRRSGVVDPSFGAGFVFPMAALRRPETRAFVYGAGSGSGKATQSEEFRPDQLVTELQAVSLAGSLGAPILTNLTGAPVTLRKIVTGQTLQFVAEGSALVPGQPTTDKLSLTPRIAGAVTSISPILLQQPMAQQLVSDHLLRVAAAGLDRVIFAGGGSNEPSGLWDTLTPSSLGEPTWAEILGMIEGIELDNVGVSNLGWALNPSAKRKLRSTPKVVFEGSPYPDNPFEGFIMESPNELAGYKAVSSTTIPTTGSPPSAAGVLAGDFSDVVAGVWESASILLNPFSEADYLRGQIGVRVLMLCDVVVKREESFRSATISI